MLYRFKSRATADLVMVEAQGDRLLRAMGREPAVQGVVTVAQMPGVIARLEAAIAAEEAAHATAGGEPAGRTGGAGSTGAGGPGEPPEDAADADPVGLAQRAWPMLQALREAHRAGVDLVWGV